MAGTSIGPYRILEKLGAGGMGEVYLADDTRLGRRVALKTLPDSATDNPEAKRRLLHEARAAATLNHPNIASIYDILELDGRTHIVMEYVRGDTLSARLRRGPLPVEQVVEIGIQLADALEEAHAHGIVHRDLKPANVCVTPEGKAKVLDFGVAKSKPVHSVDGEGDSTPTASALTRMGQVLGTPGYMAPEQLRGKTVDHRTDIYSLGVLLFELSTGRRPFVESDAMSVALATLTEEPPHPTDLDPGLPWEFSDIVMKAMARKPADRFRSAAALRTELRRLNTSLSKRATGAMTTVRGWASGYWKVGRFRVTRKRVAVAASIGVLSTVALVGIWWSPWSRTGPVEIGNAALRQAITGSDTTQRYLVVLPLAAAALDDQALNDGLTDALTSKLSQLSRSHGLQVASTSMVRELDEASVNEVGTELGVTLAVLCGVDRDGEQVRVSLTLVEAPGGREIATDTVTAAQGDPFLLQDRVLDAATRLLDIELETHELDAMRSYGTQVPEAYYLYLQGRGHLERLDRDSDVDRAISTFRRALELDPDYALAHAGLGAAYWQNYDQTNQPDWTLQAAAECREAVELDAQQVAGHVCLGTAYGSLGRHDEAIDEFSRAIGIEPTSPDALRGLAVAYEQMGRIEDAEQAYEQAIEALPDHWAGYRWLGAFYVSQSRYADASAMLERVVELTPDSYKGYSGLGVAYVYQERWPEALAAMERSVEIKPSVPGYSNLATLYFFQEARYFAAARMYEEALKLDERNYFIWGNLGDARYWGPDEQSRAAVAYERALSLAEELRRTTPQDSALLGDMALYNAMLGREALALEFVRDALTLAPDDPELQLLAAQTYQQLGRTDAALQLLEQALDGNITPPLVFQNPWFESIRDTAEFQALVPEP